MTSYVLWQEGPAPYVVVEFLLPGTEAEDLGRFDDERNEGSEKQLTVSAVSILSAAGREEAKEKPSGKFDVYETHLRVPYYFVYSRYTQRLRYFKLDGGSTRSNCSTRIHEFG